LALKLRPTGLGHGVYKDDIDFGAFSGEWLIGRIFEQKGSRKIIDLDSWETGYADGELGRAPQCPIDSDCDPFSYSMGYREGLSSRAGTRRKAPRLRCPQLSIEVRRPHSS
jgi:hypothetical protein